MASVLWRSSHQGTRIEEQWQRDLRKIKKYRDLDDKIRTQVATWKYDHDLLRLTTELLHLNPEYYTIWNVRRGCLTSVVLSKRPQDKQPYDQVGMSQESDINALKSELSFTIPLLMGSPKCYWIWNFRQWILSQAILRLSIPLARGIWEEELRLTSLMISKDQRNFHAWGYRRFLVAKLESATLQGKSMVEEEFKYTTKMIGSNLSNFSAWHNRNQLIPRLLQERGAVYVRREIHEIKDLLDDYKDVKYIFEALLEYTLTLETLEQYEEDEEYLIDQQTWLTKLRVLDPMRTGKWKDVKAQIGV